MPKTETKTAAAPAVRSPARAILAGRLAVREHAKARVDELVAADRRLDSLRREAEQLAADVAAADADTSAPDLALALVRVQAKIAASGSERERIAAEMLTAGQALMAATVAVNAEVPPVLHEEADALVSQIEALNRQLFPLCERLAGLRVWALNEAHRGGTDQHRAQHARLMQAATDAITVHCPFVKGTGGGRAEASWHALAEALTANADAEARP